MKYYPNGGIKEFTYGNGIKHTLTQNARGLPDTSCDFYGSCNASAVLNDGYDYDQNGNVAAISDGRTGQRGNRTMTYDGLDRLTQVVSGNGTSNPMFGTATYTYDLHDNLTRVNVTGGNQPRNHYYCYNSEWRLAFVRSGSVCTGTASPALITLEYDVQGNLKTRNTRTYTFDFGNRLRSSGNPASNYAYDGYGRRVLDQVGTGRKISQYTRDGQLIQSSNSRNGVFSEYFYLQGSLVAIRERDTTVTPNVYSVKYQHTDALGSPVVITNESRGEVERTYYEPYGWPANRLWRDGPGYTGHVEDAATQLTYMQQRYYDPQLGVFLSVDPVTAYEGPVDQFHRYRYANNNPYRFTDPDGRQACPSGERCIEARSTRDSPAQPGPNEKVLAADAQTISAVRKGEFSDGTKIDMSQREQSFSANENGTKAGIDQEARCMNCGGEDVLRMTFKIPHGDSAGHTHGGDREQLPGIDDAPASVGSTRRLITKTNVMSIDRTQVGVRVRVILGPMPRGSERRKIERRIEQWNRNEPLTCVPATRC